AAVAAVAEQPPAGPTVGPGPRSAVGAVADQRSPGEGLGGLVDRVEDLLLQGVQWRAGGGVESVST
ncbi:hypothetical protein DSK12_06215, partial [Mycobacterium tuberculosis]